MPKRSKVFPPAKQKAPERVLFVLLELTSVGSQLSAGGIPASLKCGGNLWSPASVPSLTVGGTEWGTKVFKPFKNPVMACCGGIFPQRGFASCAAEKISCL